MTWTQVLPGMWASLPPGLPAGLGPQLCKINYKKKGAAACTAHTMLVWNKIDKNNGFMSQPVFSIIKRG